MTDPKLRERALDRHAEHYKHSLCILAAASDIFILLIKSAGDPDGIPTGTIKSVIEEHTKVPITDRRQGLILEALLDATNVNGVTGCAMWEFAHDLDHLVYEVDLPPDEFLRG